MSGQYFRPHLALLGSVSYILVGIAIVVGNAQIHHLVEAVSKTMFGLLKNHAYSIGVDVGYDSLRLAQLGSNGHGLTLIAGNHKDKPGNVNPAGSDWQRWAIDSMHLLTAYGEFHGKEVIAAMPASEVFIDHIKKPKVDDGKLQETIFSKIKQKLPFESLRENTLMQYILMEEDNVMVLATERRKVDRNLAIYEEAGLSIKSIGVWPVALTNSYIRFFGRRNSDLNAIVMLLCIEADCTNVVVCRHSNLLLARSISVGFRQLDDEQAVTRLVMELTACKRQFSLMYRNSRMERLLFLSGRATDKEVFATIAKQLEMPAQVGDCLAAVEIAKSCRLGAAEADKQETTTVIDRRDPRVNWAVAFGLSLL
jgi:Tfp pilus assembly PilM family ATPase